MPDYRHERLSRYLDDAAAATPTPGGGSVAAVAAALASTMASMAAGFTAGREKFANVAGEIDATLARLRDLRSRLLDLAAADAEAYTAVRGAQRLPSATDEQQAVRAEALAAATERSFAVVEAVLEGAAEVVTSARRLAEIANPNLRSDVAVAAELALGAVRAARANVLVNAAGLADAARAAAVRRRTDQRVEDAARTVEETRRILEATGRP